VIDTSDLVTDETVDSGQQTADAALADPDARPRDGGCGLAWNPQLFDPCMAPVNAEIDLDQTGTYEIISNTTNPSLTGPGATSIPLLGYMAHMSDNTDALVLLFDSVHIRSTANLRLIGALPVIVASLSTIEVDGTISVNTFSSTGGAGAHPLACATVGMGTNGGSDPGGGGGGAGGGFLSKGGDGGVGNLVVGGGSGGGAIGLPSVLRGGCRGGDGGAPGLGNAGAGGGGGGAVQLAASQSIAVSGVLHAGGARGDAAKVMAIGGGGGGGSGGMIWLEALSVSLDNAILAANGGGGGEGADNCSTIPVDGQSAQASADPAIGGSATGGLCGDPAGGDGGDGAASSSPAQPGGAGLAADGGGGGGGGVGYILVRSSSYQPATSTISPPAMVLP
jgi:hypothetical protein